MVGIVVVSATVVVGGLVVGNQRLGPPVDPRLPDLVMAPIEDVNPGAVGVELEKALRFGARIANIGDGDFVLSAKRSAPWSNDWVVYQRFQERAGGWSEIRTGAGVTYGLDAHNHWHVSAVEAHRLERLDTGAVVTEVVKQGFCFFDTDSYRPALAGAPPQAKYAERGCEGIFATSLDVGLSIGWLDDYPWPMMDQRMAVDRVPSGRYRIHEIADPFDWFEESDETNNETWIDVEIDTDGPFLHVKVLGRAPEDPG